MQIKTGGRPIEVAMKTVRKVWERGGNRMRLAVVGTRGLQPETLRECPDIPFLLEQPCDSLEEIKAVRNHLDHALYLDENAVDFPTVLRAVGKKIATASAGRSTELVGCARW